jgi:hypothetical protein
MKPQNVKRNGIQVINLILKSSLLISNLIFFQDNNFRLTKDIMRDVMSTRSTIVSGKMTVDEEKEARKKIISKMNFLNKSLGISSLLPYTELRVEQNSLSSRPGSCG